MAKRKLHLYEKESSTLAISFNLFFFFFSKKSQKNADLGVGSDKITADYNLANQRENICQNVSENFDSDLKKS